MRRVAISALALALIAIACARPRPRIDAIEFWEPWPPAVVAPLVAHFEAENPAQHVHVRQMSLATVSDSLAAALAAGAGPDLCVLPGACMPRWLASSALCDWSAGVADLRDSLRGWPLCTVGEALYGLPCLLDVRTLLVHPQLFARAGLDSAKPPHTWEQLHAAAVRVQKLGHGVHGFGIATGDSLAATAEFLAFVAGNGGQVLSQELDSARIDSPEALAALAFYLSLRRSALVAAPDTLAREFAAGRLAMMLADAPARADVRRAVPGAVVALVPRPAGELGTHATWADAVVLVGFTGSHRKEAALRLARSLARREGLGALAAATDGLAPAYGDADSLELPAGASAAQVLARQGESAHFAPAVAHWDSMCTAIAFEVGEALHDRKSAAAALTDAAARVTELAGRR